MSKISRREFLRSLAAGMGVIAFEQLLAACGLNPTETPQIPPSFAPRAQPTATRSSLLEPTNTANSTQDIPRAPGATPSRAPAANAPAPTLPPTPNPDLVVARGGEPEELARRALAALGGIERFVPKDSRVIVKPNICVAYHSYEYAATTNPFLVGALVKLCLEAGAREVQVLDEPFGGSAEQAYQISGIQEQVEAAGGKMVVMPRMKYARHPIPNGIILKEIDIYDDILNADAVINVPIAKHHNLARLTLGMKNLMGIIQNRPAMHSNIGQKLADLSSLVHPTLTIVDAIRILVANGPTGGNLDDVQKLDTLVASPDLVAADSYAATLFGRQPQELDYIIAASAMGLGNSDLSSLRIEEVVVGA
jgi:uncharacterized protein (DUF362 family)